MNIQDLISIAQHEFESLSSNSTIRQTSSDSYTHHIHTPSYQQSTVSNPSSSGSPSSSPPPIQRITSHLISLHSNQYNTQKQFPSKKSVSHDQYQHYPHHPHYPQFKVHYDSHQQSYQPHYPQPYPFTQTHPANYSLKSMDKPKVIRTRTLLSNEVLKDLNTEFLRNKFPSSKLRDEIAVKLSLSPYIVSSKTKSIINTLSSTHFSIFSYSLINS